MLIENKEERVLMLPKSISKRVPGKKSELAKGFALIPGISEVPDELWIEYKKQSKVLEKINRGDIVEVITKTVASKKVEEEIIKDEEVFESKKEEIEKKKKLLKAGKIKKEDREKVQQEIDEFEEAEKMDAQDIAKKKASYLKEVSNFNKLDQIKKEELIANCFDVKLLNKWKDEDVKSEVRKFIDDQLESIDKAKIQPGLKKPTQMTDGK